MRERLSEEEKRVADLFEDADRVREELRRELVALEKAKVRFR